MRTALGPYLSPENRKRLYSASPTPSPSTSSSSLCPTKRHSPSRPPSSTVGSAALGYRWKSSRIRVASSITNCPKNFTNFCESIIKLQRLDIRNATAKLKSATKPSPSTSTPSWTNQHWIGSNTLPL